MLAITILAAAFLLTFFFWGFSLLALLTKLSENMRDTRELACHVEALDRLSKDLVALSQSAHLSLTVEKNEALGKSIWSVKPTLYSGLESALSDPSRDFLMPNAAEGAPPH